MITLSVCWILLKFTSRCRNMVNYRFNEEQYFVIEQFDKAKPFSSFLPGLAGLYGIPMWSFYVNRGQGIVSFGIKDKNNAIKEFYPANQAYERVSTNGFRTFIKVKDSSGEIIFEPFTTYQPSGNPTRRMFIKENELKLEEINNEHGVKTIVTYFTMPNENYAGLVRKVELINISDRTLDLEVVDGLASIIPFGVEDAAYKAVGNTLKSWMDVFNLEKKIPYYRVRSSTNDTAEVEEVTKGHFYLSFLNNGELLEPIVDADLIFGFNTSKTYPTEFATQSVDTIISSKPITANKVPSGFSGFSKELNPGEHATLYTLIGHVMDIEIINEKAKEITSKEYMERKYLEANKLVSDLTSDIYTKTNNPLFDAYCQQSYLDNILRGGYPVLLPTEHAPFVYYVFSRKHGDLERDYNFFSLAPEFFSQGNGNFRDVNQNRRNDVFFHPEIGDYNIKLFMSLIQADGYNPLVVKGSSFELEEKTTLDWLQGLFEHSSDYEYILKKLQRAFTPGDLLQTIVDRKMSLTTSLPEFLKTILTRSKQSVEAEFGEGYWMDHWTYNLDLIENFLKIYPEKRSQLLFEDDSYRYFSSPVYVKPRSEKYVLKDKSVRQYNAIVEAHHEQTGNWLKSHTGEEYTTNLFSKLFTLGLVKFATLDPLGMGIEMEANKPGWNDSMNGLPGLLGSALSETLELRRVLEFNLTTCKTESQRISLPVEVYQLLLTVVEGLRKFNTQEINHFQYWDYIATAREQYREEVRHGFREEEVLLSLKELETFTRDFLCKVDEGIERAIELGNGLVPTYLYYEAASYEKIIGETGVEMANELGLPFVNVTDFKVHVLPHFLEGPARAFKTTSSQNARKMYQAVRESDIFDSKLHMYKTSASLEMETYEIGRSRAFTSGWLERESIFMHMEFKYLLGVLKAGLYEEFFQDIKYALPPFMNPEVYGRSVLENSSFIASSVNPDPKVHGQGFVARLSGTTAEFLTMWQTMMMGKEVFSEKEGSLILRLQPILPDWLFDENGKVEFSFLGRTLVTYHNPKRKNTFGIDGVSTKKYILYGKDGAVTVNNVRIEAPYAQMVRAGEINRIEVYLD